MNLQEFINYKTICPICQVPDRLRMKFHSDRTQHYTCNDDEFIVKMVLKNITGKNPRTGNTGHIYKAGYHFNLHQPQFSVEFYDAYDTHFADKNSLVVQKSFLELHGNLQIRKYSFYKICKCLQYEYHSQPFSLDLKKCTYPDLQIVSEIFYLEQPIDVGYRVFKLKNILSENVSFLNIRKVSHIKDAVWTLPTDVASGKIYSLPIIDFVSKQQTTQRINDLLIYL